MLYHEIRKKILEATSKLISCVSIDDDDYAHQPSIKTICLDINLIIEELTTLKFKMLKEDDPIEQPDSKPLDVKYAKINVSIRFKGIDDFGRPVFETTDQPVKAYIGSVKTLFPNRTIAPRNAPIEISDYFKEHLDELEYFGTRFGCEPHGGLSSNINLIIIY